MSEVAQTQIEITVLWAGGWDTFLVDLDDTTDIPPTAQGAEWKKNHKDSTFYKERHRWLMCRQMNHSWYDDTILAPNPKTGAGVHSDEKGVKILKHIGGGD
jgi:hypothetical protein